MVYLCCYAPHSSAQHYLIELQWGKFKKSNIGQRFGQRFLRENGEGRRAPTSGEHAAFFEDCAAEMAELYSNSVTISHDIITGTDGDERRAHRPLVTYVPPFDATTKLQCQSDYKIMMAASQKVVDQPDYKDVREFMADWNTRTVQLLNGMVIYSADCPREQMFGPSKTVLLPEMWVDPNTGQQHHSSYLQKKEKYSDKPQTSALRAPIQGREKYLCCFSSTGCSRVVKYNTEINRHNRLYHGGKKRSRPAQLVRTRKRGRKRVRVTGSEHLQRPPIAEQAAAAAAEEPLVGESAMDVDVGEEVAAAPAEEPVVEEGAVNVGEESSDEESSDEAFEDDTVATIKAIEDTDDEDEDYEGIEMVVGKRQMDDEDVADSDAGHCTLIWWAGEDDLPFPQNECT